MIKVDSEDRRKLNSKMFSVMITNACSLSCGGCDQFCGLFSKTKQFFISLAEFQDNIRSFRSYKEENWGLPEFSEGEKLFLLYGGEPSIHPQFAEILSIAYENSDIPFVVYTNGRPFREQLKDVATDVSCRDISRQVYKSGLPRDCYPEFLERFKRFHSCHRNVAYRIDYKTKDVRGEFVATLCAPCDMEGNSQPDGRVYWERAKRICYKWNFCENCIYKNKAYSCNVAGAMDHMFYDGCHGWEVKADENPFRQSATAIQEQMKHFCYRCGYNCEGGLAGFQKTMDTTQYIHKGSLVTSTNEQGIDQESPNFQKCELVTPPTDPVPLEVFR